MKQRLQDWLALALIVMIAALPIMGLYAATFEYGSGTTTDTGYWVQVGLGWAAAGLIYVAAPLWWRWRRD